MTQGNDKPVQEGGTSSSRGRKYEDDCLLRMLSRAVWHKLTDISVSLKIKARSASETSVALYHATRRSDPEDCHLPSRKSLAARRIPPNHTHGNWKCRHNTVLCKKSTFLIRFLKAYGSVWKNSDGRPRRYVTVPVTARILSPDLYGQEAM